MTCQTDSYYYRNFSYSVFYSLLSEVNGDYFMDHITCEAMPYRPFGPPMLILLIFMYKRSSTYVACNLLDEQASDSVSFSLTLCAL